MSERERRRAWIAFGIALVAITIFRVLLIAFVSDRTFFGKYFDYADALRAGTIAHDRIPDLSPGYLWTIALLRAIGFGVDAIRILQIVLLSGVAAIAGAIANRLSGMTAAIVAAILVLGSKAALVNATDLEPEIFLLFFSALGLLLLECGGHAAALASGSKSGGMAAALQIAAGLSFGLATAFRPVALLAASALFVWLILRHARAFLFAIGFIVPVLGVLLVNRAMTGSMLLMDPGTVFYEGMNANATGYAGVAPRIVKDIEQTIPGSDTMHVAYRVVASHAMGRPVTREEANRYWSQKSLGFVTTYPMRAISLVLRKVRLLVSAHDAYDVPSMVLKDRSLGGLWISWALLVPLALYGIADRRSQIAVLLYSVCAAVSPIVFFVTTRHRLPLLIGLVILGSIGAAALIERRAYVAGAMIVLAAVVLSIPGDLQREDDYLWTATFEVSRAMTTNDRATAATWLPESVPPSPPDALRAAATRELSRTTSPARSFSIAIALLHAGDAAAADQILQRLQSIDYHPYRRTRAVSSVAYYRARALIQLRRMADARTQAARARVDAPGDADVLAMSAFAERDPRSARQLDHLHDPFTRDWALARAAFAIGDQATANRLADRAAAGCPEWPLPADLR
jgi:Dolichyl-phosphate-mannose-protein mannosyltransferase